VITLAVADLDRVLAFYRDGLGLEEDSSCRSIPASTWPRTPTSRSARPRQASSASAISSQAEPKSTLCLVARRQSERCSAPAHDRPWGIYSGYFRDPGGHLWEIIWNPRMLPSP